VLRGTFRNPNVKDSGGGEMDEVAAGVQYLVSVGFVVGIEKVGVVDSALVLHADKKELVSFNNYLKPTEVQ
jgi:hypothetical protein